MSNAKPEELLGMPENKEKISIFFNSNLKDVQEFQTAMKQILQIDLS